MLLRKLMSPDGSSSMPCYDTGDTTWVLISTVLVLGMMPGLSLFEAGLLRSKNTISIMTQTVGGLILLSVLWDLFGFSLVYGEDKGGIIGNFQYSLLLNVPYDGCFPREPANKLPAAAFAMFQMMFACITPLLLTGAVAERLKVKCFFIFCVLWEILVFYPVAHWIWGGGWLDKLGALDFAGGIVIHTSAGVGAIVLALMLGRRRGFDEVHGEFPPSNMPLAATGGVLLWMGWFGFNAGSALQSGPVAVSTVVSTQIGGAVSGCVWLFLAWWKGENRTPSFVALLNGVIAGLAGITPASGYISTQSTLVVGVLLGVGSYYSLQLFKHKLRIDDALDVSSVHGVTGIIGSLSIGFACDASLSSTTENGLIYGGYRLIWVQPLAVIVTIVYSGIITYLIAKALDMIYGLRVPSDVEDHGLDLSEHKETAYHELHHPSFSQPQLQHQLSSELIDDDGSYRNVFPKRGHFDDGSHRADDGFPRAKHLDVEAGNGHVPRQHVQYPDIDE
eukprot:TRINITY_DN642_c0_g1_i1.p1 TRINITY_DN642_c0_g1~~TRINITY_DN642_c0_g1_i1.p1  ORF type:complete len:504 (-),score=91.80 TRINITY_DN642_c0_g1_i1:166-1677(-)